jgi:hypothetical protein
MKHKVVGVEAKVVAVKLDAPVHVSHLQRLILKVELPLLTRQGEVM